MKEQFKIYSIFTDFRAISCVFGPTKKNFETYFKILLHIQLQEAISNQSAKSTSKNIEKWLRYWIFVRLVSISIVLAPCQIVNFWAIESTFLGLLP